MNSAHVNLLASAPLADANSVLETSEQNILYIGIDVNTQRALLMEEM